MSSVPENCRRIIDRVHRTAMRSGRSPSDVRIIAVTKTVPPDRIRLAIESGISDIGENRLQEALPKQDSLANFNVTWHFIGHLQTNKARKVVDRFDWVHSIDRLDLGEKLHQHSLHPLSVLIEVKLHDEPAKSGVAERELPGLIEQLNRFDRLRLRGLMAIPPFHDDPEGSRPFFQRLRKLAERFSLPELSMGMSHDFEIAIEEGATMVRIGTALFGERAA